MVPGLNGEIILADKDGTIADRLGSPLQTRGFETKTVESASECIDQIEAHETAAVVSVYDLPDLNGLRLLRSIRVTHPTLPFFLDPLGGSESMASEAIAAGVDHYVSSEERPDTTAKRLQESIEQPKSWLDEGGRRYRHLVKEAPVPINLFDETGESVWCNNEVLDLLDLESRDNLIGESIFQYIHPEDRELAAKELEEVIEKKESVGPTKMKLRTETGETRHVYVSTAIGSFLGEDIGQAVIIDTTDLRKTRRELQDERAFIESALDSLDDLFYVLDADRNLIRWNKTVEEITGYGAESIRAMRAEEFFVQEDRSKITDSMRKVRDTGNDTFEATLETAAGQRIPYEFRVRWLEPRQPGDDARMVGIGRDISDRKERERQLLVLERWLRHNIRNDLNHIMGRADMIRRGKDVNADEHAAMIYEAAQDLVKQADHQRKVVDVVLDPSEPERLDLESVVQTVLEEQKTRYPEAKIELRRTDQITVYSISELRFAIQELVQNAIVHNDAETPTVGVEVIERESSGIVRIEDNGPGIPDIEQVDISINREMDQLMHSSGMGLFVAHWIVLTSDGRIEISENTPRGSVLTVSLPKANQE